MLPGLLHKESPPDCGRFPQGNVPWHGCAEGKQLVSCSPDRDGDPLFLGVAGARSLNSADVQPDDRLRRMARRGCVVGACVGVMKCKQKEQRASEVKEVNQKELYSERLSPIHQGKAS